MEPLLLAQGFNTVGAPSCIEFTLFSTVSRRKTHQGGTREDAAEGETDKKQQSPQPEPKKVRRFSCLDHFPSTQKKLAKCAIRLGDWLDARIVLFFELVHAAVRFR